MGNKVEEQMGICWFEPQRTWQVADHDGGDESHNCRSGAMEQWSYGAM